jgi:DNA-binding GntR family transcriptional regulator
MLYAGEFDAGERLRLKDLQDRFGVSHIPIREALRTLEAEGLVENLPQRGAVAAPVSIELLSEIYDARRFLEPALAARAAPKLTEDDLSELAHAFERLETSGGPGAEFFEVHREFHWITMRAGASDTLEKIVKQLWGISERFVRLSLAFPSDVQPAYGHHRSILELSTARDPKVAEVVLEHLHLTEDALLSHYTSEPN